MDWGMTETKEPKEPCQLNQLLHILLIEGQLFILITLMPSFAVLCFTLSFPQFPWACANSSASACYIWANSACYIRQWICHLVCPSSFSSIFNIMLILLFVVLFILIMQIQITFEKWHNSSLFNVLCCLSSTQSVLWYSFQRNQSFISTVKLWSFYFGEMDIYIHTYIQTNSGILLYICILYVCVYT